MAHAGGRAPPSLYALVTNSHSPGINAGYMKNLGRFFAPRAPTHSRNRMSLLLHACRNELVCPEPQRGASQAEHNA